MKKEEVDKLRNQLSVEAKNGIDFTVAATAIWAAIAFIWTLKTDAYTRSVLVFFAGGAMLPLALLLSRVFKTNWKNKSNPLQPLGLWLNFAQLFYFPFLIFVLIKQPEYFIMTYAIITGAHFFPYAWFYRAKWYAIFAGAISAGSLLIALYSENGEHFLVGVWTSLCLAVLSLGLLTDYKRKRKIIFS
ncbi:hypothetical protein DSECCO2_320740 [anaerobic digester metagenome]